MHRIIVCLFNSNCVSVLGMKAEQQQQQQQKWSIHLQAKAKNFDIKLKATKYLPTFFRFSLFLKISHLLIRVSSDNNNNKTKSLKSKITQFFNKFRSKPAKKDNHGSTVVIGNLALLIESISKRDTKGIIVRVLNILLYIVTQLKTFIFIGMKTNKLLLMLIFIAMLCYPLSIQMTSYTSYGKRSFASRYIRKAWNWATARAFLHTIAQVI